MQHRQSETETTGSFLPFIIFLAASLLCLNAASAAGPNPFSTTAKFSTALDGTTNLHIAFSVPPNHYLYAKSISTETGKGEKLIQENKPAPYRKYDQFSDADLDVYTNDITMTFRPPSAGLFEQGIILSYQGCSEEICFFPVKTNILPTLSGLNKPAAIPEVPSGTGNDWKEITKGFSVTGKKEGYVRAQDFIKFLDDAAKGTGVKGDRIQGMFDEKGIWTLIAVFLILAGGLGLNLTPCVLPMIPINIAIIGAGAGSASRMRGFALGGIYGLAIALTYGLLGLFVVLTGTRFGTLNASPLFNAIISLIFAALALAMFDIFSIDFSRYQSGISNGRLGRGTVLTAFFMGTVSALLAGACVAPVVVSVLLLSADLFQHGNVVGLFLPFLLGAGMALPWPFMGAGISFLPRPGQWMVHVKHIFGVLIIGLAIYYALLAYRLYSGQKPENRISLEKVQQESIGKGWLTSIPDALAQAQKENKPVFIDFWASWCKNCMAMEETTFKNQEVERKLEGFVKVKFRAERPNEAETLHTMKFFNCLGLPTYVVLVPGTSNRK